MSEAALSVRFATVGDAAAIARLHLASWRAHYRGILPDERLDDIDPVAWEARRRGHLAAPAPGIFNWVCEADGVVAGWGGLGPARDADLRGAEVAEIYSLYVDPAWVGRGLGRALCGTIERCAWSLGAPELVLWVLQANDLARRFYRAAGFELDARAAITDCFGAPSVRMRQGRPTS